MVEEMAQKCRGDAFCPSGDDSKPIDSCEAHERFTVIFGSQRDAEIRSSRQPNRKVET